VRNFNMTQFRIVPTLSLYLLVVFIHINVMRITVTTASDTDNSHNNNYNINYDNNYDINNIKFLNKYYSYSNWYDINAIINCMVASGSWMYPGQANYSGMIYSYPCVEYIDYLRSDGSVKRYNKYVKDTCDIDNLKDRMSGLHYYWKPHDMCVGKDKFFNTAKTISITLLSSITWNRCHLCQLLNNHRILFYGDSLTGEFFHSTESAIINSTMKFCGLRDRLFNSSHQSKKMSVPVDGSIHHITYQELVIQDSNNSMGVCGSNISITLLYDEYRLHKSFLDKYQFDLLIYNRGAHYVSDDILLYELNNTLSFLQHHYPDISIIYRSTSPGHVNFQDLRYSRPLSSKHQYVSTSVHNWDQFEHQNELTRLFLNLYYRNIIYLDIYPSTMLRGDGHNTIDGLHYCIPGPIDQWVVFLYNTLNILHTVAFSRLKDDDIYVE